MSVPSNSGWAADGLHILALAKYGSRAASTRQRLLQYAPFLAQHEIGIDLRPLLDDTYLAGLMEGARASRVAVARAYVRRLGDVAVMRDHDLLWIQYELFPYLPLIDGLLAQIAPARSCTTSMMRSFTCTTRTRLPWCAAC